MSWSKTGRTCWKPCSTWDRTPSRNAPSSFLLPERVTSSVLNVNPGTYGTMDILEQELCAQEASMDEPFPRSYVGLLVADATSAGGGGGPTGLITVDPVYVEDDYIIAHELAHTYWPFWAAWIAEGGADFMTTVSVNKQFSSHDCSLGDILSDLDRLYGDLSESGQSTAVIRGSGCAYSLGRGLLLGNYIRCYLDFRIDRGESAGDLHLEQPSLVSLAPRYVEGKINAGCNIPTVAYGSTHPK